VATWASLTQPQKDMVTNFADPALRPALLRLARSLAMANLAVVPQYLASPSALASTMASPASDSVAGILATLTAGEMVPIGPSGLAGAAAVRADKIITYTAALNNLIASNFTAAIQQDLALFVGSVNLINAGAGS
jgi:hypothetical protein